MVMRQGKVMTVALCAGLMGLAGCAAAPKIGTFASYSAPAGTGAVEPITLSAADGRAALAAAEASLKAAGAKVTARDLRGLTLSGVYPGNGAVDCGTITQNAPDGRAELAANAARSVLFDKAAPGKLKYRLVAVETDFALGLTAPVEGVSTASLTETHKVTIRTTTVDQQTELGSETQSFASGTRARFADRTVCVTSGALQAALTP